MKRIELPGDNWAELAERSELSVRERRKVERRMVKLGEAQRRLGADRDGPPSIADFHEEELDGVYALQDQTIVSLVTKWSLGELPTMETVSDLAADVYDALSQAVSQPEPGPDFDASKEKDPKVPTGSSVSSVSVSPANPEPQS